MSLSTIAWLPTGYTCHVRKSFVNATRLRDCLIHVFSEAEIFWGYGWDLTGKIFVLCSKRSKPRCGTSQKKMMIVQQQNQNWPFDSFAFLLFNFFRLFLSMILKDWVANTASYSLLISCLLKSKLVLFCHFFACLPACLVAFLLFCSFFPGKYSWGRFHSDSWQRAVIRQSRRDNYWWRGTLSHSSHIPLLSALLSFLPPPGAFFKAMMC